MFQNISEHDVVELFPVRKLKSFNIRHLEGVVVVSRSFRYRGVELNALNQTVLPPSERDLVQQYFAGLDQQGPTP